MEHSHSTHCYCMYYFYYYFRFSNSTHRYCMYYFYYYFRFLLTCQFFTTYSRSCQSVNLWEPLEWDMLACITYSEVCYVMMNHNQIWLLMRYRLDFHMKTYSYYHLCTNNQTCDSGQNQWSLKHISIIMHFMYHIQTHLHVLQTLWKLIRNISY